MTDGDALLAAILANPDDDTPRLVYADWLQESGDPDRAEFIRLQIECAKYSASRWVAPVMASHERDHYGELLRRERSLLGRNRKTWLRPFQTLCPGGRFEFYRGVIEEVILEAGVYWRSLEELCRLAPIQYAVVRNCTDLCRLNLAGRPQNLRLQVMTDPGGPAHFPTGGSAMTLIDLLPQSPTELELFAQRGHWVILAWSIWSAPDRAVVARLRNAVRGGWSFNLGLRPFDEFSEFFPWCSVVPEAGSPHWMEFVDGRLSDHHIGITPPERIRPIFARAY